MQNFLIVDLYVERLQLENKVRRELYVTEYFWILNSAAKGMDVNMKNVARIWKFVSFVSQILGV